MIMSFLNDERVICMHSFSESKINYYPIQECSYALFTAHTMHMHSGSSLKSPTRFSPNQVTIARGEINEFGVLTGKTIKKRFANRLVPLTLIDVSYTKERSSFY